MCGLLIFVNYQVSSYHTFLRQSADKYLNDLTGTVMQENSARKKLCEEEIVQIVLISSFTYFVRILIVRYRASLAQAFVHEPY